jgi:general secretion pathway protein C
MELYLKRYFWVIPVLVVVICAVLLAMGVNHLVEGKYLLSREEKQAASAKPHKPVAKPATISKDYKPIVQRNLFCSDPACDPPTEQPAVATTVTPSDPNNPPATSLPLALVATSVAGDPVFSSATVINTQSTKGGSYWLGEEIPDAGRIVNIEPRWVDFENKTSGNRVERIDLLGATPAAAPAVASTAPTKPAATGAEGDFVAAVDKGVKKVDDTHYEIDRSLVDMVLGDPNLVARGARIVPSIKDGKANGFKVYAIRPNSAFAKIGLQNGDTLHSVNGFEMTSPDKALEVYTKVKSANNLTVTMTRRGQPVTMEYSIK